MILKSKKLDLIKTYLIDKKTEFSIDAGYERDREESVELFIQIGNNNIDSTIDCSCISCGVYGISGLPKNWNLERIKTLVQPRYRTKFLKELYSEIFVVLKKKERACTILASTNNSPENSMIISTFNSISKHKTFWCKNPNSGNKIRTWIF